MEENRNKTKAKMLLQIQPRDVAATDILIPWMVRVLVFLLDRYIEED